ncbi:MAG: glycosyltransferase [Acidobacteria bacterium]|nr:glycosyltransferase [Acidobacteriota bacterium]
MKILQVLYYYTPHCSGLTIYAQRLGRELVARGHQVTILAARFSDELPAREIAEGMLVVRVPVRGAFSRGVIMPGFLPAAVRLMRQHDVVHLHLPMAEAVGLSLAGPRARVRALMPVEGDLAFRRRCETILEWLDPAPVLEHVPDASAVIGELARVVRAGGRL